MAMKIRIRPKDMKKIIEEYKTLKDIGIVCEYKDEEGNEHMLIKFMGSIYIDPATYDAYICEPLYGGMCDCKYSDIHTYIIRLMAKGQIRFI